MNFPASKAQKQMPSKPNINIGLLWHSLGSGNLGVGALTLSQIFILRKVCDSSDFNPKFQIIGWGNDPVGPLVADLDIPMTIVSLRELINPRSATHETLSGLDIILDIGAGDSFSDIYGSKRFFYLVVTKLIALMRHTPLILSPQTIGPFSGRVSSLIAKFLLKKCEHIFPRDKISMEVLRDMGVTGNATEAIDVAFRLPFQKDTVPRRTAKMKIGVNISALLYHGGYDRSNQFGLVADYPKLTHRLLMELSENSEFEVHLIPHVVSTVLQVEDDHLLAKSLHNDFPNTFLPDQFQDPMEAKSYISGLDLLIGSRMHATIAAFSSGVPVLPLAYSRKFKGLFDSLGYSMVADLTKEGEDEIMLRVSHVCSHLVELRNAVDIGNQMANKKLQTYEQYLTGLLKRTVLKG
jgi:colanic acid/amylovoran biosynthesis protein WcaK/AmsJ